MKTCTICKIEKPISEFHKSSSSKDGAQSRCKPCAILKMQEWQKANPERYKKTNSLLSRGRNLRKHGFTEQKWDSILGSINHKCQICGENMDKPYVDHDHVTGLVRGALCTHCNRGLGAFFDSPEIMLKAIKFLQSPPLGYLQIVSKS